MIRINSKVKDQYGEHGIVVKCYDDFSAACADSNIDGEEWLEAQEIPLKQNTINEIWYGVLCTRGGAIISPESLLELI